MYGEISAGEVETKSPLVQGNGIYVISRFRVSNAKRSFRPVASQFITFRTQVSATRERRAWLSVVCVQIDTNR